MNGDLKCSYMKFVIFYGNYHECPAKAGWKNGRQLESKEIMNGDLKCEVKDKDQLWSCDCI